MFEVLDSASIVVQTCSVATAIRVMGKTADKGRKCGSRAEKTQKEGSERGSDTDRKGKAWRGDGEGIAGSGEPKNGQNGSTPPVHPIDQTGTAPSLFAHEESGRGCLGARQTFEKETVYVHHEAEALQSGHGCGVHRREVSPY